MDLEKLKEIYEVLSKIVAAWVFLITTLVPSIDPEKIFCNEIIFKFMFHFSIPIAATLIYFTGTIFKKIGTLYKALILFVTIVFILFSIVFYANYVNQKEIQISSNHKISEIKFERKSDNISSFMHPKEYTFSLNFYQEKEGFFYFEPTERHKIYLPSGEYEIQFKTIYDDKYQHRSWVIYDKQSAQILIN